MKMKKGRLLSGEGRGIEFVQNPGKRGEDKRCVFLSYDTHANTGQSTQMPRERKWVYTTFAGRPTSLNYHELH